MVSSVFDVSSDGWDKAAPGDKVTDTDRDKGKTEGYGAEMPLLVYQGEGLDEHEDKGVAETR